MWRHAKRMKKEIEAHLESSAMQVGAKAMAGVFLFTLLMITREGMETALLMGTLLFQEAGTNILIGAVAGTLCAAFVAWLWSRYGHRVNLALFFQVTAVFLSVFVVQLLIYGFHELTEANLFPYSEPLHWATEPYGPDGRYGQFLTYLLRRAAAGVAGVRGDFRPQEKLGSVRCSRQRRDKVQVQSLARYSDFATSSVYPFDVAALRGLPSRAGARHARVRSSFEPSGCSVSSAASPTSPRR